MAGYILRGGQQNISLPADALDKLLQSGQGDAALLYLALQRFGRGVTPEELEKALPISRLRIDAAERYLKAHPVIPAVLSGGQGAGEDISEARAMYDALTARGIDLERLILEEQSANTRQNLQNSLALLPDDYHKTVAIVTNDFHMGRVRLLLNAAGPGRVVQVPAKLPWWWLSANYYLRESFAVVNDQVVRPLLA